MDGDSLSTTGCDAFCRQMGIQRVHLKPAPSDGPTEEDERRALALRMEEYETMRRNWEAAGVPRATIHVYGLGAWARTVKNVTLVGQGTFTMEDGGRGDSGARVGSCARVTSTRDVRRLRCPNEGSSCWRVEVGH